MTDNKTALTELIEHIKANVAGIWVNMGEGSLTKKEETHYNAVLMVCKDVIAKATELLAKEKNQIVNSYLEACGGEMNAQPDHVKEAEDYYNTTYSTK